MKKFNKAVIIGVGQIGASLGLNLTGRRMAREVIGIGRNPKNLREAIRTGAIHRVGNVGELSLLGKNDLVILATPVRAIVDYFKKLSNKPLVIDVGSTKGGIVREGKRRSLLFIGCHPIAGTEKAGASAGDKNVFRGNLCIVTPTKASNSDVRKIEAFWKSLGAKVVVMEVHRHDQIFAAVSHLPHAAAFGLMTAVARLVRFPRDAQFIFSSLKGMTRIAASPAEMWCDIFLENRNSILVGLGHFLLELKRLKTLIAAGESRPLLRYIEKARKIRLGFPK